MATAVPSRSPAPDGRKPNDQQLFGRLRQIRAAAQYLQGFAGDTLKQVSALAGTARAAAVSSAFTATVLQRLDDTVTSQLEAIRLLFTVDVEELEWCADDVATIRLRWARVKDLWPAAADAFEQMETKLAAMDVELDQIVYKCASLTLSPRVNDALANVRIGQVLDFDFEYGDELPKSNDHKKRLLLELAQEGGVLAAGVVDADQRVIYKTAMTRTAQIWSAWRLAFWVIAGALAIPAALAAVTSKAGLDSTLLRSLLKDYIFIFAGSGAHLAVEAIKSAKAQENQRPSFQALNDWILWLHVRERKVFWGIAYVWLGYVLLPMTIGVNNLQWQAAFFAGYSIDSVVEILLGRFESTVKGKAQALVAAG
jgi:hypothetical protein